MTTPLATSYLSAGNKENAINEFESSQKKGHHHEEGPSTKKPRLEESPSNDAKSPHELKMAALDGKTTELEAEGKICVVGMDFRDQEDEFQDEFSEQEEAEVLKNLTQAEVDKARWVIITKERGKAMEEMEKIILGERFGDFVMMFDTSFSYEVMDAFQRRFRPKFHRTKDPAQKFNLLFGFTHAVRQFDCWMYDNEGPLTSMVTGLARMWKNLLQKHTLEALKVDEEFTGPGIQAFLKLFKNTVENELPSYGQMKFKFE